MKATLLALLTLGSLAMADQAITLTPCYSDSIKTTNNFGSQGIVFTLKTGAERYNQVLPATGTVNLTSIEIAMSGNYTDAETKLSDKTLIVTDSTGVIVGFSAYGDTKTANHKEDWGWNADRNFTTWSDFTRADMQEKPITLNMGDEYHLYFMKSEDVIDLWTVLAFSQNPVNISTEDVTKSNARYTVVGNYSGASDREYGLVSDLQGTGTGTTWAPLMGVTVQNSNVPEPTTGTLSLLALAGLCIRRRK